MIQVVYWVTLRGADQCGEAERFTGQILTGMAQQQ